MGLCFAIALTNLVPANDPIHQRNLPADLARMVARGETMPRRGYWYGGALVHSGNRVGWNMERINTLVTREGDTPMDLLLASKWHEHTTTQERQFVFDVTVVNGLALSKVRIPAHDDLVRDRRAVLNALADPDRPARPSKALRNQMAEVFTQAEILALKGEGKALPGSLPEMEAETRARISEYLVAKAATVADGQGKHKKGENAMDKTAQQPTRGSVEQRERILSALLLNTAGKATFNDLGSVRKLCA